MAEAGLSYTASPARQAIVWLAGVLLVLLVVRVLALAVNGTDLFFDEAQYWSWGEDLAFGYYSKPPLIAWIIRAATEVCGPSEFCVRLPSPIIHTVTAVAVFLLGRRLYDTTTGLVAALGFATIPGISLSSGIISTDVPLLLFWTVALLGFVALFDTRAWWPALLIGLGFGLGLNAKYAMAYFVLCTAIYLAVTPERRAVLRDGRLWAGFALGVLLIVPNMVWNAQHSFATFSHTADNANWGGQLFNPGKMLEFLGAQFGVFGPILFGTLIALVVRFWKSPPIGPDRLLLAFALPVLCIVTMQAFISRAHANWAAVSYIAAVVLVSGVMVREQAWRWIRASFAIHAAVIVLLAVATAAAGRFALPGGADPFARTLGWRAVAEATRVELAKARAAGKPFGSVLTDDRSMTAELLYYMRGEPTPVLAWRGPGRPEDHYELSRPFTSKSPEPVLLVSLRAEDREVRPSFRQAERMKHVDIKAGTKTRRVVFYRLSEFRSRQ
jgi:4-amino-4-deoxy-L-arabinose transferase-like glycosyltransferase